MGWLRVKVLATKPDGLSLIPAGTHMVEGENQFLQVVLWCVCTHIHTIQIVVIFLKGKEKKRKGKPHDMYFK